MKKSSFTPEQSLELITEVIQEARARFAGSGQIYMFWGCLLVLIGLCHFFLNWFEAYQWIIVPYLFIPLSLIVSRIWQARATSTPVRKNAVFQIISRVWIIMGVNMIFLGFGLFDILGSSLLPVILILQSIGVFISGVALRKQYVVMAGLLANCLAVLGFWLPLFWQPLLLSGTALVSIFIPGLLLHRENKTNQVPS